MTVNCRFKSNISMRNAFKRRCPARSRERRLGSSSRLRRTASCKRSASNGLLADAAWSRERSSPRRFSRFSRRSLISRAFSSSMEMSIARRSSSSLLAPTNLVATSFSTATSVIVRASARDASRRPCISAHSTRAARTVSDANLSCASPRSIASRLARSSSSLCSRICAS